jgi:hypothetical protein
MKLPRSHFLLLCLSAATLAFSACTAGNGGKLADSADPSAAASADSASKPLFNGKDLSGWDGLPGYWSVRDGAITGQTTAEKKLTSNTFLIWKGGDVKNFELRAKFKLSVNNDAGFANSGVQYRSKIIDAAGFVVGGYQCDIDTGKYIGMLYEEKGRGILMQPGQKIIIGGMADAPETEGKKKAKQKAKVETVATVTTKEQLEAAYKVGEWTDLRIVANGNHLEHYVNGKLTADVTDNDPEKRAMSGVLALQLHQGQPMTIQFKDLQLKMLP